MELGFILAKVVPDRTAIEHLECVHAVFRPRAQAGIMLMQQLELSRNSFNACTDASARLTIFTRLLLVPRCGELCKRAKRYLVKHMRLADGTDAIGYGRSCEGVIRVPLEERYERHLA